MYSEDLVLVNGKIITMDPARPDAEAVLVRNGRIAKVGSSQDVLSDAPGVQQFDCAGRVVVPGFIDGHCHLEMTCIAFHQSVFCQTPPLESLSEIADRLRLKASDTPPGTWIIGRGSFGIEDKVQEGRHFNRRELDAVSKGHPIVVYAGFHVGMLNTLGLKELGLWERPEEPPPGVFLHLDGEGKPTGVATEIWDLLPPFTAEESRAALKEQVRDLFVANGVTTAHTIPFSAGDVTAIQDLQAEGEFPLRIRTYYHVPRIMSLDSFLATGLQSGFGDDMMRIGGVKIFVNGIHSDGMGNTMPDYKRTEEELTEFVGRANRGGVQLMMHTLGSEAVRFGAKAIESAVGASPDRSHRMRLEHGADAALTAEDMDRLANSGISLVATPQFLYSAGGRLAGAGPASTPLRSLIDRGFEIIGASDSTGTVPDGIAPLFNIACAVSRRTIDGSLIDPQEAITAEEGLKMFTLWAAKGGNEDREKGSIEVGKLGDFAILSDDPREVPPEGLFDVKVDATILSGQVVFER